MTAPHFDVHPFLLGVEDVAKQLDSTLENGLTDLQVQNRLEIYGPNQLEVEKAVAWYSILIKQFCNAMIIVLFIILAVSFGVGDVVEGSVVGGVILINVSIGFFQESRAEKKMDALRSLSSPSATVIRNGHSQIIPNSGVVPGDVVMLRMGDTVPADVRLSECVNLSCDEQAMTGESLPVDKVVHNCIIDALTGQRAVSADNVTDGDRINLAFASTTVSKGRGRGIVIATGMATSVGRIAAAAAGKRTRQPGRSMSARKYGVRQPFLGAGRRTADLVLRLLGITDCTPLQRRLTYMSYALFLCAVLITLIVFAVHAFRLSSEVVLYATSTGIAIIPESLSIVLIMSMVQAARVMRKAHVVVRDLAALESLGGVTNICSDKTGTLTKGAMLVKKLWLARTNSAYTVQGTTDPHDPTAGTVVRSSDEDATAEAVAVAVAVAVPVAVPVAVADEDLQSLLVSSALCNAATVRPDGGDDDSGAWLAIGEPTEIALQVLSMRFGLGRSRLEGAGGVAGGWTKLAEFPFDSAIKRMSVVYARPDGGSKAAVFAKGAVESMLARCSTVGPDGSEATEATAMTEAMRTRVLEQTDTFAAQGLRVLAVAARSWTGPLDEADAAGGDKGDLRGRVESGLSLLGLVAIYDPPREETAQSIRSCAEAGICVHMLTGDHPATARAIASEVGILPADMSAEVAATAVMAAGTFDGLTDAQLDGLARLPLVVARCSPSTKTRMIEALQRRRRRFTAMTGDGVNDAPSLRRADVGIAMGSGSDVAKSAAALVLADDRFSSIVAAVREGRRMFDNIQKFMLHLLASNVAEVVLLVVGLAFRDRADSSVFPLSALHILWINIFTSALPALGLGMEAAAPDVMRRRPRGRSLFTRQLVADMLVNGLVMGAVALLTFVAVVYGVHHGQQLGHDCNRAWSPGCRAVFRARATVFVQLTYLILFSAWEFTDARRSLLHLLPGLPANRLLFWSVLGGLLPPVVLVYVPAVGRNVMRHAPISWEWALVFAGLVVYFLACEAWKYTKRTRGWFEEAVVLEDGQLLAQEDEPIDRRGLGRSLTKSLKRVGTSFSRKSAGDI